MRTYARAWDDISKEQFPRVSSSGLKLMRFMEWKHENTIVSRLHGDFLISYSVCGDTSRLLNKCELIV